ncbi:MAG TPA: N-acetylmuramidase [Gammaproteobacteria bacterium]|nr:N-acetylmuramidase [Gammaproteobacteria bacterium]
MADFEQAIAKTLEFEGGNTFTNDSTDRGGATRYGISQNAYPDLDIQNLNEKQAKEIYRRDYWNRIRGDDILSQRVAENIFDACVNMGVRSGSKLAQLSLGIEPADGIIGPQSLKVINAADEELFLAKFALAKMQRYVEIVQADSSQKKYLLGWLNRTLANTA